MIDRIDESAETAVTIAKSKILDGGLICFRSDTVYGFACDSRNDDAVLALYELKNRPVGKSIAIFVNNLEMARKIFKFDDFLLNFCDKYLPGQVTVVADTRKNPQIKISKKLNLESNFLGFRIIEGKFINELISELDFPLAVTSANISGLEELLSDIEVYEVFKNLNKNFLLIKGGVCKTNGVSTVIKVDQGDLKIIREGIIKIDE